MRAGWGDRDPGPAHGREHEGVEATKRGPDIALLWHEALLRRARPSFLGHPHSTARAPRAGDLPSYRALLAYSARLCRTVATPVGTLSLIHNGWGAERYGVSIMTRRIAIGLAAVTIVAASCTLTASAIPGGGSLGVAQSVDHGDNVDKVGFGGGGFGRGGFGGGGFGRGGFGGGGFGRGGFGFRGGFGRGGFGRSGFHRGFGRAFAFHPGFRRGFGFHRGFGRFGFHRGFGRAFAFHPGFHRRFGFHRGFGRRGFGRAFGSRRGFGRR